MALEIIAKADSVTATWGVIEIGAVQSIEIGGEVLEPATMFAFFTGTGKNAQAAGSNVEVEDTTVTATLDVTTWTALVAERATGCAAHVPADLVIAVCYAGQTATATLSNMVFSGKSGLSIGKNTEIPVTYNFQHQDLDGTADLISFAVV